MAARTWLAIVATVGFATAVTAGPVTVRQWITPKPGQSPFDPAPGSFAPEFTFTPPPAGPTPIASFLPNDLWAAPTEPYTPGESKAGSARYEFTYHAEVTDSASGGVQTFALDGLAQAEWMQRYDGLLLIDRVTVGFTDSGQFARSSGGLFQLSVREVIVDSTRGGASVELTVQPTETPEPGTLVLAAGGLAVLAGVWRKKQRRAVLTPDHLPL
jgi:hypothetical protein